MATTTVTVKSVRVFNGENGSSVQLTLAEPIKGYVKGEDGTYAEGDTNVVSLFGSRLTAQLCDVNDDIALYRAMLDHAFGQREFGAILFNAKIKLEREFKAAGEVVKFGDKEVPVTRDCYITDVVGITLSDRAVRALDAATAL